MEKWQLAGIISGNSKSKLILPTSELLKSSRKKAGNSRYDTISKAVQQTLRKMTDVIALF